MITWAYAVLDLPEALRPAGEAFWSSVLGSWLDERLHPAVAEDDPPRVHLELEVSDLDTEAERLAGLGATVDRRIEDDRRTLTSPGGAPFCLVSASGPHDRRPAVTSADGVRRRLVQLCLDIPHGRSEVEAAFWRAALPWRWVEIAEPEFLGRLMPSPGAPLELLLQELGADDPGTAVRAHLDLGSDDLEATVAEVVELGAVRLHTGDGFVALRDPVGLVFCVTAQSPDNP